MTAQNIWKVIAELWPVFSSMDITCVWVTTNIGKSHIITHFIPKKKDFFLERLIRFLLMEFYGGV